MMATRTFTDDSLEDIPFDNNSIADFDADYEQARPKGEANKNGGADDDADEAVVQNKKDSLRVWISMAVVLGMIALTAAVVLFLAYEMLSKEQEREFTAGVSAYVCMCMLSLPC